jgi:hypothetical protein
LLFQPERTEGAFLLTQSLLTPIITFRAAMELSDSCTYLSAGELAQHNNLLSIFYSRHSCTALRGVIEFLNRLIGAPAPACFVMQVGS